MPLLETSNLTAFYGDFQALFGITLSIEEGETIAIIGANGAGKSTFLKTIAGLRRISWSAATAAAAAGRSSASTSSFRSSPGGAISPPPSFPAESSRCARSVAR